MPKASAAPAPINPASQASVAMTPTHSSLEAAQKLIDGGLLGENAKSPVTPPAAPAAATTAAESQAASPAAAEPEPAAGPQATEEHFASLEDYLGKQSLDRDAFFSLPVKAKVDGKEFDVPLAKLLESYQLGEHLAHKSNAFAEDRRKFEAERDQQRTQLAQQLQAAQHFTQAAYQHVMGNAPTAEQYPDAGQLALAQLQYNQRAMQLQQQYAQLQNIQTHVSAATLQAEQQKMLDAVPEWRDAAKFQEASRQLAEFATKQGFTPAEFSSIVDHRYVLTLHKAARADALQAEVDTLKAQLAGKTAATLKLVRAAPPMASPGARITENPTRSRLTAAREGMRTAKQSNRQDAQLRMAQALVDAGLGAA